MSFSYAELTSKELRDFSRDFPILIGNNVFDHRHLLSAKWSTLSDSSGADTTDSSYPIYRATGRDASALTKDTHTGANHYAHFDPVGTFSIDTCSTTAGSNSVSFDFNNYQYSSLQVGMTVVDNGADHVIHRGSKIASITPGDSSSGSSITLDKNVAATKTNTTLTFYGTPGAKKAEFDSFIVFNHNIHSGTGGLGNSIFPKLWIRNTRTQTSPKDISYPNITTPITGEPIVYLNLHSFSDFGGVARRYSDVEYVTLALNSAGGDTTGVAVGSVWAGKRWQLPHWPRQPYHDKGTESDSTDYDAVSGITIRHSDWQGRAFRQWSIPLSHSADIDSCLAFQEETSNFTKPFVLIETPNTDPKPYIMMAESASMVFPKTGVNERVFNITMVEKPPFLSSYT